MLTPPEGVPYFFCLMANETKKATPGKKLKERFEEFVQDILDTLGAIVTPEPELIPVPARRPVRPYRR